MPLPESANYFGKDLEAMSFAHNYHRWIFSELAPFLGQTVAEVGAGVGNFSKLLLSQPIRELVAFEPSKNMYPFLRQAIAEDDRAHAVNGFLEKGATQKSFDSIVYVNVLEHIEDDASELAQARQLLNVDGHLLIFVPALPWLYSELDKQVGHFRRYLKRDLAGLVQGAGYTIVKARYFDMAGIIPWYINFVLLKNAISGGGVSLYDRAVVPPMRLLERLVTPPIGKNILLVAKKA